MIETTHISDTRSSLFAHEFRLKKLSAIAKTQWLKRIHIPTRFIIGWACAIVLQIALLMLFHTTIFLGLFLTTLFISLFTTTILFHIIEHRKKESVSSLFEEFMKQCKKSMASLDDPIETHRVAIYGLEILSKQIITPKNRLFTSWQSLTYLKESYHQRDVSFAKTSLIKTMIAECLQLIQINPKELFFHSQLVQLYLHLADVLQTDKPQSNMIEKAIDELLIIKEYLPENSWTLNSLITCYGKIGQTQQQLALCEELYHLSPNNPKTLFTLGEIYFTLGKKAKGLEMYDILQHIHPELAKPLLKLYTQQHI